MSAQPSLDETDPLVGSIVQDRYRVVRRLGEGGMGCVYEAEHQLIGKHFALKVLNKEFATDPTIVARFMQEAKAATATDHEHIIDVTDMGMLESGSPFIVMEYLKGKDLGELLELTGPLPVGRAVRIMMQVCSALHAAHVAGIVHRDLKPENIFLTERSSNPDFVKVLDFGISKMQSDPAAPSPSLTQTGMAMGTPHYMSPEQAQGLKSLDHRADIYALGVILYRSLAGTEPFDADTFPMLMVKVMTEDPGSLLRVRSDIPEALDRAVQRALKKDPDDRFSTVAAFSSAIAPYKDLNEAPQMDGAAHAATVRPPALQTKMAGSDFPAPHVEDGAVASVSGLRPSQRPKDRVRGETHKQAPEPVELSASAASTQPAGNRWLILGIAAAILGITAGVAAMVVLGGEPEPEPDSIELNNPQATAPEPIVPPAPTVDPSTPSTMAAATAPAETVQIRISVSPSEAKVFIDDVEYPNPCDVSLPQSSTPSRIRLEAERYETIDEPAVFDRNQSFNFRLERRQRGGPRGADMNGMTGSTGTSEMTGDMGGFRDMF